MLAIVIIVTGSTIAILGLRWAITEFDEAMLGQHTRESVDGATRMAERMGLVLVDGDNVVYGEVTSAFPDSSAYLVITTPSADQKSARSRPCSQLHTRKIRTVALR